MTTPPMPSRPSAGRSSFAIAMKDYTFIRPGIAVTISAATLIIALILGLDLVTSLQRAARTVQAGATAVQTLHQYSAGLEVWRQMATSTDPAYRRPEAVAQRDSLRHHLQDQLVQLSHALADTGDQELVHQVLEGLTTTDAAVTTAARAAMIVLQAHEDNAMFEAAEASQRGVLLAAALLGLTIVAAGTLVIPMAWLYIRYKRGATIEVKI
jgi:hypothetical protein